MSIKAFPHKVNSRHYGCYYYLSDGRALYLAHRKRREVFRERNAWCIDLSTLNQIRDKGITTVGVMCKSGKDYLYWVTHIDDFFGDHSFGHFGDTRQRGLPLTRFALHPDIIEKYIKRSMRIR